MAGAAIVLLAGLFHARKYIYGLILPLFAIPLMSEVKTVCTSGCDFQTVNAAIVAASCGDVITLAASQTHYGGDGNQASNNPIVLRNKSCTPENPITITTDQAEKLPYEGTRITPNYADGANRVAALVRNSGTGMVLTADVGNLACGGGSAAPCPAHDYNIVGLEFCCSSNSSDFIGIGSRGQGTSDPAINTIEDLPYNIKFDRVIIRTDPLANTRRCFTYEGVNITLFGSWIECAFDNNASDSQGVGAYSARDIKILNNYIAGTTEPVNLSGACSPIRTPVKAHCSTSTTTAIPTNIEVAFNEVTKPAWLRYRTWSPGTYYPKGQIIHPTGSAYPVLRARAAGKTGDQEPVWALAAIGETVTDESIVWERTDVIPQAKNLLEAKAVDGLNLHHNFFHGSWPQGQQGYAVTLTTSTSGAGPSGLIRNVQVENNIFADSASGLLASSSDSHNDPNSIATIMPTNAAPYVFASASTLNLSINGGAVTVNIPSGTYSAAQIVSILTPQVAPALVCEVDDRFVIRARKTADGSGCFVLGGSSSGDGTTITVTSANTVLGFANGRTAQQCFHPRTGVWYGCGALKDLSIKNNLWAGLNANENKSNVLYLFGLFNGIQGIDFAHNTVDAEVSNSMRMIFLETQQLPLSNVSIRDNLFGFRSNVSHPITQGGSLYDFSAINYMLCNVPLTNLVTPVDSLCPAGVVTHNLFPGVTLWNSRTRDTRPFAGNSGFNSYPSDNWNDSWNTLSFVDTKTYDYTLDGNRSPNRKFIRGATDRTDVGVDTAELSLIRGLTVRASDKEATMSFSVTRPIKEFSCVVRVSTDPGFSTIIEDLDPSRFERPDYSERSKNVVDGLGHIIRLGRNVALAPNTQYHYHLMCWGSSSYGSFRTSGAQLGTNTIRLSTPPRTGANQVRVEWGYDYDQSTGIQSPAQVNASCPAGQNCQASIPATAGRTVFYRYLYLNGSGTVIGSEPVRTVLSI
jgi:hypothetical protein